MSRTCGQCKRWMSNRDFGIKHDRSDLGGCHATLPWCAARVYPAPGHSLPTNTAADDCPLWSDGTPSLGEQAIELLREKYESDAALRLVNNSPIAGIVRTDEELRIYVETRDRRDNAEAACIAFARNLPPRKP